MSWVDLSTVFDFGDTVPEANIETLFDNLTAICSGDANSPKFETIAFARGPAVGKNAVKGAITSLSTITASAFGYTPQYKYFDVNTVAFVPAFVFDNPSCGGNMQDSYGRLQCVNSTDATSVGIKILLPSGYAGVSTVTLVNAYGRLST